MQEQQGEGYEAFARHARLADVFFLAHVTSGPAVDLLPQLTASAPTVVVFDSSPQLQALARLGGTPVAQPRHAHAHQLNTLHSIHTYTHMHCIAIIRLVLLQHACKLQRACMHACMPPYQSIATPHTP